MPLTPPPDRPTTTLYQNFAFPGRWQDSNKTPGNASDHVHHHVHDHPHKLEQEAQNTQNTLIEPPVTNERFCNLDDTNDYKDEPVYTFCGSCKNHVMTAVRSRVGRMTVLFSTLLCLTGCAAGCCLVPFLVEGLRDVIHFCPNCQITLGRYRRSFNSLCHTTD